MGPRLINYLLEKENITLSNYLIQNGGLKNAGRYKLNSVLIKAANLNNIEMFQLALSLGADINSTGRIDSKSQYSYSALQLASRHGYYDLVKIILKNKDLSIKNHNYNPRSLIEACDNNHEDIVLLLLTRFSEFQSHYIDKAFAKSVEKQYYYIAEIFLKKDLINLYYIIDESSDFGNPFLAAIKNGDVDFFTYLLNKRKEWINSKPKYKKKELYSNSRSFKSLFCSEIAKSGNIDFLDFVVKEMEISINNNRHIIGAAFSAIKYSHIKVLNYLYDNNINENGHWLKSNPVKFAVECINYDTVKYLLEKGFDPTLADKMGNSALSLAYKNNDKEIVELIHKYYKKKIDLLITGITSSGCLERNNIIYSPENVIDQNYNTFWIEGHGDKGTGSYLNFYFNNRFPISQIKVIMQNTSIKFNEIKLVGLVFYPAEYGPPKKIIFPYNGGSINFDKPVITDRIKLIIYDVAGNSEYTGINEIEFYNNNIRYNIIYEKSDIRKERSTVNYHLYEPINEIKSLNTDDKPDYINTIFEGKRDNVNTFYKIMYWNFNSISNLIYVNNSFHAFYNTGDIGIVSYDTEFSLQDYREYGVRIGSGRILGVSEINIDNEQLVSAGYYGHTGGNQKHADGVVIKYDDDLKPIQYKKFGGGFHDYFTNLHITNTNTYIVSGSTRSYGIGNSDYWLLCLDKNFTCLWQKTYGSEGNEILVNSRLISGELVLIGTKENNDKSTLFCIKTDINGNTIWTKNYEAPENLTVTDSIALNGHVYIIGYEKISYKSNAVIIKIDLLTGAIVKAKSADILSQFNNIKALNDKFLVSIKINDIAGFALINKDLTLNKAISFGFPNLDDYNYDYVDYDDDCYKSLCYYEIDDILVMKNYFIGSGKVIIDVGCRTSLAGEWYQIILKVTNNLEMSNN